MRILLRKTLREPYFEKQISVAEARKAVARIERVAIEEEDPKAVEETLRDPTDDHLVGGSWRQGKTSAGKR